MKVQRYWAGSGENKIRFPHLHVKLDSEKLYLRFGHDGRKRIVRDRMIDSKPGLKIRSRPTKQLTGLVP